MDDVPLGLGHQARPDHETWQRRKETSPVRTQWDPERDVALNPLPWRSLQIGIGGRTVARYVDDWVVDLQDITAEVRRLAALAPAERTALPVERPHPLTAGLAAVTGATST